MAYTRYVYNRINWMNKSESLATPLGKTNLNRMDSAIYNIAENMDVAYNEMSTGKLDKADADKLIVGMPTWNRDTGVLTIRFYDNTTFQIDFNIEKIPVSFSMDSAGVITMTTADGTEWTADVGDVIPTYTFVDTDTISITDTKNGDYAHTVKADIKPGSIKEKHLQPNYLADVKSEVSAAKASAKSASDSADSAEYDAKLAQSYAIGGSGIREGEDEDCAKVYKEKAEQAAEEAGEYLADLQSVQVTGVKGSNETTYRTGNVNITPEDIGLGNVGNYKAVSTVESQGLSDTEKANARNNIGAVNLTGDTMTGALSITGTSNAGLTIISTNQPQTIVTRTDSNGNVLRSGMLQVSTSNYFGLFDVTKNKWLCYADASGNVVLNGSANLIKTTISNPTSASTYYIPFLISNSTGNNKEVYQNDGVSLALLQGTASALGYNDLRLGNSITQGTAGNKYGQLTLCSYSSGGVKLRANTGLASFVNVYLPSSAGTLALTSNLSSYLPLAGGAMTGTLTVGANSILFQNNRVIKSTAANGIEFYRTDASGTGYAMWINNGGNDEFTPRKDGGSILGRSNARWGQIYSTNSAISTSDRKMKHDISYVGKDSEFDTAMTDDQLEDFMMGLMACIYRLNDGTSGRPHHGFVAQDIEELMERIGLDDHAAFIKSPKTKDVEVEKEIEEEIEDPDTGEVKIVKKTVKELQHQEIPGEYIYSLRYEEFIADIIRFIQIQKNRADDLDERLTITEHKNLELERRLEVLEPLMA